MIKSQLAIIFFLICAAQNVHAGLILPQGLTELERQTLLNILGFGTSTKMLADPYPLGGYAGVEIGVALETVPTEDVTKLGTKTVSEKNVTFPKVSLAKGVYENVDLFFQFMPYNQSTNFANYAGMLRWGFYQAAFFPGSFSLLVHGNSANFGNVFFTQTSGFDVVSGVNIQPFGVYLGVGRLSAAGRFAESLTAEANSDAMVLDKLNSSQSTHFFFGATVEVESVFIAGQIDQYNNENSQTTTSLKIGARY